MASRIKLFQFAQKCSQTYGIHLCHSNQKHRSINFTSTIFMIGFAQFTFTTAKFIMCDAKSILDYGFGFYLLISLISVIFIYLIFIWQSENTLEFIENCEGFIEKRVHSTTSYNVLIGKIELFNKLLCYGIGITIALFLITVLPYTFVSYYIFNMGEKSFYLFLPASFPFNWKTPLGYLVAWLAQCVGSIVSSGTICHFLNIVFGSGWLFVFIAEDITQDVTTFNDAAKVVKSNENQTEITKCFYDMVQIYTDAKQCAMEFNQVFKYSLFAFIAWDMFGVSSLLVTIQFELWSDHPNLFEIALLTVMLFWIALFNFLLCEPGARVTNQFERLSDELNQCDWHLLPIKLQRCYITFLSDTQNPIKVISYANIPCERETSKKMINTAYSYFNTFRNFKP